MCCVCVHTSPERKLYAGFGRARVCIGGTVPIIQVDVTPDLLPVALATLFLTSLFYSMVFFCSLLWT